MVRKAKSIPKKNTKRHGYRPHTARVAASVLESLFYPPAICPLQLRDSGTQPSNPLFLPLITQRGATAMKRLAAAIGLVALSPAAFAGCFGTGSFKTCTDNSGNSYNIQRFGNTTNVQGFNSSTGSSWNQHSTTIGNTTFHNGTSASGNSWNGTSQRIGDTVINSGTDSRGNAYHSTCNSYGCY